MGRCRQWIGEFWMSALFEVDRFDIEQEIMQINTFAEIIKNYADMIYDGDITKSDMDSIHTTLHGFANLLDAHSDKMYTSHKKHYNLDMYSDKGMYGKDGML